MTAAGLGQPHPASPFAVTLTELVGSVQVPVELQVHSISLPEVAMTSSDEWLAMRWVADGGHGSLGGGLAGDDCD